MFIKTVDRGKLQLICINELLIVVQCSMLGVKTHSSVNFISRESTCRCSLNAVKSEICSRNELFMYFCILSVIQIKRAN